MINLSDPVFSDLFISGKPWLRNGAPGRILAIRLQATGDTVITLPYLQELRRRLPAATRLDFLTREETAAIPRSVRLFDRVFVIRGKRNFYKQLCFGLILIPALWWRRYDVVIDLQNNLISRLVRKSIAPVSWSLFDKTSSRPAGERTRLTIEAAGLGVTRLDTDFALKHPGTGREILLAHGWDGRSGLVVLNPAAAFVTRNWPLQRYVEFARQWRRRLPDTQFILLGTRFIAEKAAYILGMLDKDAGIDLVGNTSPSDAFSVLQHVTLVLSEDSGLMHMAWVSGIPTMALFGGSRSDWARPVGPHTAFLDADDLPCAPCMLERCPYGDVHCMSRHSVEKVLGQCLRLVDRKGVNRGPYARL